MKGLDGQGLDGWDPADAEAHRRITAQLESLAPRGVRPGLDTIRSLLRLCGSPHRSVPTVLVGGTNGKGSVAAALASMAQAAGYRTGLFTSPHLETPADQVRIDGVPCAVELADRLEDLARLASEASLPITAFEALTAAAFGIFARHSVDLAVVEAGLGGRLDSTNVASPLVSVVTTVAFDHEALLGPTLEDIARHKAGLFRRGRPAIVGWCGPVEDVLLGEAEHLGARPIVARRIVRRLHAEDRGEARQRVTVQTPRHDHRLDLQLPGVHQARNVALAVLVAEELAALGFPRLDADAIAAGARACRWPGRLESIDLPGTRPILLDAAHNPAAVEALVRHLEHLDGPFDLLFGAFKDKNFRAMLSHLGPRAREICLTRPPGPRAWDPSVLNFDHEPWATAHTLRYEPCIDTALARCLEPLAPRLVVAGSLRLIGDIRLRLRARAQEMAP